jgi:iron complex outermembrane receptor protein
MLSWPLKKKGAHRGCLDSLNRSQDTCGGAEFSACLGTQRRTSANVYLGATAFILSMCFMNANADTTPQSVSATSSASVGAGSPSELVEIVVTARKRAENIQDVPLSVSAFDQAALSRNFVTQITDIAPIVANVTLQPVSNVPGSLGAYIRGVGSFLPEPSQDPAIGISIDGVYLASQVGSVIDIFDVAQVEVLSGPQAVLQGRNSPGGVINITTRQPSLDAWGGHAEASYGNFDTYSVKASEGGPIIPGVLGVIASAMYDKSDGYVRDITTGNEGSGQNRGGGRLGLLYTPNSNISFYLTGEAIVDRSPMSLGRNVAASQGEATLMCIPASEGGLLPLGGCVNNPRYVSTQNYVVPYHLNVQAITGNLDWKIADGLKLTSVSGYRNTHEDTNIDSDATAIPFIAIVNRANNTDQVSQEVRLASDRSVPAVGRDFDWVVGAYYLHYKFHLIEPVYVFGALSPGDPDRSQSLNSEAVFGQVVYHLTDRWSISAGGRESWDDKDATVSYSQFVTSPTNPCVLPNGSAGMATATTCTVKPSANFSNFSAEAGTQYNITEGAMAYFRFAQGYRSGGINADAAEPIAIVNFQDEKINSYEIGIKTEILEHRLILNAATFRYDYTNLQQNVQITIPVSPFFVEAIQNAGAATVKGAELQLIAKPTDRLTLRSNVGYLDATLNSTGATLPFSPKFTSYIAADYEVPVGAGNSLTFSGDVSYRAESNNNESDEPIGVQGAYEITDASVTYHFPNDQFVITGFVRNVFNTYYINTAEQSTVINAYLSEGLPRTYGVRIGMKF